MRDGMPNALTVNGTAARIERAWCEVAPTVRILVRMAVGGSALVAVLLASTSPSLGAAAACWGVCGALLAVAALVDVRERRLPNGVLAEALLTSLLPMCLRLDVAMSCRALLGGGIAMGLMLLVRVARGIGMGDVKMAGVVGVSAGCFGWRVALLAIAAAAAAGAGYGAARHRRSIAFGPALWFGWMSALVGTSTGWWS
jgi:leader peptidase (prepilin peptidase) / N-methyltransferase